MSPSSPPDFFGILEALATHEVKFILVGGLAAVVQGAPVVTTDVDIVHLRSEENIAKLLGALHQLDAVYRHHPAKIAPNATHLVGKGHQLLTTNRGNLDVLGSIDEGRDFDALLGATRNMELDASSTMSSNSVSSSR